MKRTRTTVTRTRTMKKRGRKTCSFWGLLGVVLMTAQTGFADIATNNPYISGNNLLDGYSMVFSYSNLPIDRASRTNTCLSPSSYQYYNPWQIKSPFSSVAYYMELEYTDNSGPQSEWVLVTSDDVNGVYNGNIMATTIPSTSTFSSVPNKHATQGLLNDVSVWLSTTQTNRNPLLAGATPTSGVTTVSDTKYTGNTVYSATGKNGTVEVWPANFGSNLGITGVGGNNNGFDFNDTFVNNLSTTQGHGSFQVHLYDSTNQTGQTLLSYSRIKANTDELSSLGIGNKVTNLNTEDIDWTHGPEASNNRTFTVKDVQVYAKVPTAAEVEAYYAPIKARAADVPELNAMTLVHDLDIPNTAKYNNTNPTIGNIGYTYDASASMTWLNGSIGRIGYLMTLDDNWSYVSMDAFTQDMRKVGVPSRGQNGSFTAEGVNGAFDGKVTNLNIASNSPNLQNTGTFAEGKIQFWSTDYSGGTDGYGITDTKSGGNDYGSMQIHNTSVSTTSNANGETVFAFNRWGNNVNADVTCVGIGNNTTGSGFLDWTHTNNSGSFTTKNLKTFVTPTFTINAPETNDYQLVYAANLPNGAFNGYSYDASSSFTGNVGRVGYYLELCTTGSTESQWIFVSGNSFTPDVSQIGVPLLGNNFSYNGPMTGMNVSSNVDGILNGTNMVGKVQFYGTDYNNGNGTVPYGPNDSPVNGGSHGSMQIFNVSDNYNTLFAYSNFNNGTGALGIGNSTLRADSLDWTFAGNAEGYSIKNLFVFAQVADTSTPSFLTTSIPIGSLFENNKATDLSTAISVNTIGTQLTNASTDVLGIAKVQIGSATKLGTTTLTNNEGALEFNFDSTGSNASWANSTLVNGYCTSTEALPNGWTGFGMHSEGMFTIDLSELRTAGNIPGGVGFNFTSFATKNSVENQNGDVYAIALLSNDEEVLGGYINGQYFDAILENDVWKLDTIVNDDHTIDGVTPIGAANYSAYFDIDLDETVKYLTLAVNSGLDSVNDHLIWASPTLMPILGAPTANVPEPTTWAMLILGLGGVYCLRRKRNPK